MFAGSVNGGIFLTTSGGTTWTPLTDRQASLSIASLGLDPADPTGRTIIAGIGITSNGAWSNALPFFKGRGGQQTGLLYTTDGGASWSALGGTALAGQSVIDVAARGSTILAGTFEVHDTTVTQTSTGALYGLYRSINGGASFTRVAALPGPVTSLVADPSNPARFYAAVTEAAQNQASVWVSENTGATWSQVFTQANGNVPQIVLKLAAGPSGSVAVAVSAINPNNLAQNTLSGVFLSQNFGGTWQQLTAAPNVIPSGQTLQSI